MSHAVQYVHIKFAPETLNLIISINHLGDPHFMVRSPGQEAVCFDADAPVGERIVLLFDPVSGLSISGVIAHREALDRTVIDSMKIMTPAGVSMSMTHDSLMIEGYGSTEMEPKEIRPDLLEYNGSIIVGDVEIKALHRGNGLKAVRLSVATDSITSLCDRLLLENSLVSLCENVNEIISLTHNDTKSFSALDGHTVYQSFNSRVMLNKIYNNGWSDLSRSRKAADESDGTGVG